jgi:hypothetical protein
MDYSHYRQQNLLAALGIRTVSWWETARILLGVLAAVLVLAGLIALYAVRSRFRPAGSIGGQGLRPPGPQAGPRRPAPGRRLGPREYQRRITTARPDLARKSRLFSTSTSPALRPQRPPFRTPQVARWFSNFHPPRPQTGGSDQRERRGECP